MITYEELIKKPRVFKSLTGVSRFEFDELLEKVTPIWLQLEYERLDRLDRPRAIGGGGEYKIQARDNDIGHIDDFIIDDETWAIQYMIVDTSNWLPGKKV